MKPLNLYTKRLYTGAVQTVAKSIAAAMFSCIFLVSCSVPKQPAKDSGSACPEPQATCKSSIIIASDKKGLEWNVAGYLERYYDQKNLLVRNILFSDLPRYKDLDPVIVILLHVAENGQIHPDIRPYVESADGGRPDGFVSFLSTISGRERENGTLLVDGITGASEMSEAVPIAERIIRTVDNRLD